MNVLHLSIPPLPRFAATARSALAEFAGSHAVTGLDAENLTFALGEAIANAIAHARTAKAIEIRFEVDSSSIVVIVTDRGRGIVAPPQGELRFPSAFAEGGPRVCDHAALHRFSRSGHRAGERNRREAWPFSAPPSGA